MKKHPLQENYERFFGRIKEEPAKSKENTDLDNRLYTALKDLASLASILSVKDSLITNKTVSAYREELRRRFEIVDEYISRYAKDSNPIPPANKG